MDTSSTGSDSTVAELRSDAAPREGFREDTPVVIDASTPAAGVPAEYAWLAGRFGTLERDWKVDLRSLGRNSQGRTIETFRVQLKGGARFDVHFDITSFHQL
jgi:hypothetical protein